MGKIAPLVIGMLCWSALCAFGQELPDDEVQVNLNGYFDNFRVNIIYPSVSVTKSVSETTSLTGRYLVDAISAASMKSTFQVDGVTSATSRTHGGGEGGLDEVRHEVGVGITQLLGSATLSVNGLYSTEHDYTSRTIATSMAYPFARNNTVVQLGLVRSWDQVAPQTRTWTRDKDVWTLSAGLTQVLGKRLIAQVDGSYAENDGFLSDAYQVVTILQNNTVRTFEPVHPDRRTRKAIGLRTNYKLAQPSALQLGYRYYWDDWDVTSHTVNALYQHRLPSGLILGVGVRSYLQSKAYFFKPEYTEPEPFMTVDSKLNEAYSTELQFRATFGGTSLQSIPVLSLLANEHVALTTKLNVYFRHTASADWHSRYANLYAYILSIGYRIKL